MKKRMTDAADDKLDRKAGIKEGSKRDVALDKARGVPEQPGEKYARGGAVHSRVVAGKKGVMTTARAFPQPPVGTIASTTPQQTSGEAYANGGMVGPACDMNFYNGPGSAKSYRK